MEADFLCQRVGCEHDSAQHGEFGVCAVEVCLCRVFVAEGVDPDAVLIQISGGGLSAVQARKLALMMESIEDAWREEEEGASLDDVVCWDTVHTALMEIAGGLVPVRVAREDVERHRASWASRARERGWYREPFHIQLWIWPDDGGVRDSVATLQLLDGGGDVFVNDVTDAPFSPGGVEVVG